MKGDFTRNTFNPDKHFLRVLMQQSRVQLDSDWNEQASILLHYLQTLAADIIGPYAGPKEHSGFEISPNGSDGDFMIGKGRYYVNGILCENEQDHLTYFHQVDYPLSKDDDALEYGSYMVYLDVWERHISSVEDDDIREKALAGVDTATRSKVLWQVKVKPLESQYAYCHQGASVLTNDVLVLSQICMSARAKQGRTSSQPCLTEPDAQYRGIENQLYRVEIHTGNLNEEGDFLPEKTPTFKFSRENGSVVFSIKVFSYDMESATYSVEVEQLGRDDKLGLAVNDWVELVDDTTSLKNKTKPLLQVHAIDAVDRKVTLLGGVNVEIDLTRPALLRRWEQKNGNDVNDNGVIEINTDDWIPLEDGIEVKFNIDGGRVRPGDYWLIPARVVTGDVEWPPITDDNGVAIKDSNNNPIPKSLLPMGIVHHYAPLAIISVDDSGNVSSIDSDCRCSFRPLSYSCQYNYFGRLGIGTDLLCPRDEPIKGDPNQ